MYETQMQWIREMQGALRSSWMDAFFIGWNYVDTIYFGLIVIALAWYGWKRRIGIGLFYILIINMILNKVLKSVFHQPRPCHLDPLVGILCFSSYGVPSGAAQTATLLFGVVFLETQKKLFRWLAFVFALFVCFSRVYLGVHFPTDILGGIIVGGGLALVYQRMRPLIEKDVKKFALLFSVLLLFLNIFLVSIFNLFCLSLGAAVGFIHREKNGLQERGKKRQLAIVLAGVGLIFVGKILFPGLQILWAFAIGYWLSYLGAKWSKKSYEYF